MCETFCGMIYKHHFEFLPNHHASLSSQVKSLEEEAQHPQICHNVLILTLKCIVQPDIVARQKHCIFMTFLTEPFGTNFGRIFMRNI